jgi:hypothetical protein
VEQTDKSGFVDNKVFKWGALMNTQKESTQIIQGVLTGIGLWIFGHLLSGRLSFVEDIELYPTGPLIFAFPIVFAIACILVAKHSVRYGKSVYFKTSMLCFSLPAFCWVISFLLGVVMDAKLPVISFIADVMQIIFVFPCVAIVSIYSQLLTVIGIGTDGIKLLLISVAYFLPMLAGIIISLKLYKDKSENQNSASI